MPWGSQSLISDLFKTVSQIRESITHTHHNPSITTPSTIPPTSTDTTTTSTTNPPNATPNASANNTPTTTPTIITNTPKIKGTPTSLRQQTLTLTKKFQNQHPHRPQPTSLLHTEDFNQPYHLPHQHKRDEHLAIPTKRNPQKKLSNKPQ